MKTFELKSLNGKWYQGQLVIRYNLLNVLRVLILAALAAVALAILYWIVKGLIWCFVQLTPAFVWIGDNWWWLLLSLLGIVGLVWAWMYGLFRNLFKRRPKMNRPQHEGKRNLWPWLLLLALVLGIVLCWKSCSGDDKKSAAVENVQAAVYDKSFDKVIIARAYLDGVQKEVLSGCPRALVGFKFINDKPVSEYDFKGLTYDESVKIVAEDWKPLVVENLNGVVSANEFLTRTNLMKAYDTHYDTPIYVGQRVVVVGGGNVAMDAVRTAKRLGAEATIVYRRSEKELPARVEEVHHAKEEGIEFRMLTNPTSIIGDEKGWVVGISCVEMELGEPDESGRRSPIEKAGSDFEIPCDVVIMALGTSPNPLLKMTTEGLETNRKGCLVADEKGATTREGIFAGGDAVTGAATVILAMGAGRKAAKSIDEYIRQKKH